MATKFVKECIKEEESVCEGDANESAGQDG